MALCGDMRRKLFNALPFVIQYSMRWYNCHLYQFELLESLVLIETSEEIEEYSWVNMMVHLI